MGCFAACFNGSILNKSFFYVVFGHINLFKFNKIGWRNRYKAF